MAGKSNRRRTAPFDDDYTLSESVLGTIPTPFVVLDESLRVVSANSAFCRQFHIRAEETAGSRLFELENHQWDIPELRKLLEETLPENERVENYRIEHTFPETGSRILQVNARKTVRREGGAPLILLAIEDVTDSESLFGQLEQAQSGYKRLVEEVNSIIIELDTAGRIRYVNRFTEELFGYDRNELIGKKLIGTILPETDSENRDNSQLIAKWVEHPDTLYYNENLGIRKDGQEVFFNWSARKFRDPKRNKTSLIIDGNDQSQTRIARRQAQEALRLVETSGKAILRLDRERNCMFANLAFSTMIGRQAGEVEGRKLDELDFPSELVDRLKGAIDSVVRKHESQTVETAYGDRHLSVRVEPEPESSHAVSGTVLFFDDITEIRRLNVELEQRVIERTAQLRELAAVLTRTEEQERHKLAQSLHDHLQQLIVAAKMRVDGSVRTVQDERLRDTLNQISQLLSESIQESRSLSAELSPAVLYREGLDAGLRWLSAWTHDKYGLQVEIETGGPLENMPDETRAFLFRAIRELLFNTVKHAGVNRAHVKAIADPQEIRVVVSDRGRGYDPSSVKPAKGTPGGFGLFSISERLIYMGGQMKVQSAPGHGTQTTLTIPIQ